MFWIGFIIGNVTGAVGFFFVLGFCYVAKERRNEIKGLAKIKPL